MIDGLVVWFILRCWLIEFCFWSCCSVDPFVKKEWYDVKTPIMFNGDQRLIGKTPVTKTAGKSEFLSSQRAHAHY